MLLENAGTGELTFMGPKGGSVIDYTMLTSEHLDNVTAFEIGSHYAMSDHMSDHSLVVVQV